MKAIQCSGWRPSHELYCSGTGLAREDKSRTWPSAALCSAGN